MAYLNAFISVMNADEAARIVQYPCIVDVKDPRRGSLGAVSWKRLESIFKVSGLEMAPVSVALGDSPPWTTADGRPAEEVVAEFPVRFVKLGLAGMEAARAGPRYFELLCQTVDRIRRANGNVLVVLATYADRHRCQAPAPEDVVELTLLAGADVLLVDTFEKRRGESLFTHVAPDSLEILRRHCLCQERQLALAGGLQLGHVFFLKNICPDYVGFRSAVTQTGRRGSELDEAKVVDLCLALSAARQVIRSGGLAKWV